MHYTRDEIINAVRAAGIVGAGGAGFPSYLKLQPPKGTVIETVIANGSECEPLLHTDKTLLRTKAHLVVDGVRLSMQAVGAKEGIIGIKGHYQDVVKAVTAALPKDGSIRVHQLENYYPAGDEFLLVYDIKKRIIPEGGLPLQVGVVVNNVLTLSQMAEAMNGKAVTERILTVTGAVEVPVVVSAPVGTSYRELLAAACGVVCDNPVVLDGGPMMGQIVPDLEAGITKATSGIVVLPEGHFVIDMKKISVQQMVKKSKAACCQCFRCSDLCPRNLLGHEIYPHKTMRTIDYNHADPAKHITSAFLCSQCGVCELAACDVMKLSPRKIFAAYRKELLARGVKNPHHEQPKEVRSNFEFSKLALPTLVKKIHLAEYAQREVVHKGQVETNKVRIVLNRHIGAPATPTVSLGQRVLLGDVIGATPQEKMGSIYHASIAGKVTDVSDKLVEITR
ncbi:MAG: SLBB domain-containing protein [Bdellovibrio sp.]|nr:SLBB domain-containing protein [Bdellovibrio sp.]